MIDTDRVAQDLRAVLPPRTELHIKDVDPTLGDVLLVVNSTRLLARWVNTSSLTDATRALATHPVPDLLIARRLSQAARQLAEEHAAGWVDETGAASINTGQILISRPPHPSPMPATPGELQWTPAIQGVAEALLLGTRPTVESVVTDTRVSPSTAATALKFLADQNLLTATANRGRNSGRTLPDGRALLSAYADAVATTTPRFSQRVGTTWRDPIAGAVEAGRAWSRSNVAWAATGALTAAALAPLLTQVSPMVVYLEAPSLPAITAAAQSAGLPAMDGGRLTVRPFPGTITRRLSYCLDNGLNTVPWPRAYADLRTTGVRGEEAAEYLAERMLDD